MRSNNKTKSEKREDTQRNQGKMIVSNKSIFVIQRIKHEKVSQVRANKKT